MEFTKLHGLGNDYIYMDCTKAPVGNAPALARLLSAPRFGVGADGLILVYPSGKADFRMEMYNADGSCGAMCGNGIRCLGKFVRDRGLTKKEELVIETDAGNKTMSLLVENGRVAGACVDMGEPIFRPRDVGVDADGDLFQNRPVEAAGRTWSVTCVGMGSNHAVTLVPDPDALDLTKLGPAFERHALFPDRINTEFIRVRDAETIEMRVWERGSGETLACGTGACAALVASALNGLCAREATVRLRGGDLKIRWDAETNHVFMTGPAAEVFRGRVSEELLEQYDATIREEP